MSKLPPYLVVERPYDAATVDFLDVGTSVVLRLVKKKLEIEVRVSDGEGSSTWKQHEFEVPLT